MSAAPLARRISIHALLAESDGGRCPPRHRHGRFLSTLSLRRATLSQDYTEQPTDISIHALLAESDLDALCARCPGLKFLSTLSLRRATTMRPWMQAAMTYFYPRSPCGERHGAELDIHHNFPISIHALLAESDSAGQAEKPGNRDFYPRSPCGERPSARSLVASLSRQFLSTLSLRRATAGQFCPGRTFQISIHALLAESDRHCADTLWFRRHISIHALLAESDQAVPAATPRAGQFYPRSPCGERLFLRFLSRKY